MFRYFAFLCGLSLICSGQVDITCQVIGEKDSSEDAFSQ